MLRLFRSRKSSAVVLLLLAVFLLINAVSTTVKLNSEIIDYHSLTEDNIKSGMLCQGSIDEWYGPYAYTDDGAEIFFVLLDNEQFIPYKTYNDAEKAIFLSYDENSTENKQVEFIGKLEKTPSHDRYVLLGILTDEGYSVEAAEKALLPYYVKSINPDTNKGAYILAIVFGGIGILLFLPEISSLFGKKSVKELYTPTNYNTSAGNGYQSTYAGDYKSYTGAQNNTYGSSTAQQYGQSTAQGQNREYTGASYTSQYPDVQGQNREYTGAGASYAGQYSNVQGQNRNYTAQGQNREYTGANYTSQYSNVQGQNRSYTATGQNREYTGSSNNSQYSNVQGQNRDYTATTQNQEFTSDKVDDSTQVWGGSESESKSTEW